MGIWGHFTTWRDRRLRCPVDATGLVLDVGGGDQPHWRADVIVDLYPDEAEAAQRFNGGAARVDRPLFVADAADLPFNDNTFDYVVCSHTLEHVLDPAGSIRELTRVAQAGYIEVPHAGSAKLLDFPTHLWWCSLEDGVLVFRAKQARDFDPDIAQFIADPHVRRDLTALQARHFGDGICALRWEGSVEVLVEGEPDPRLLDTTGVEIPSPPRSAVAARALTGVIGRRALARRRRRRPVTYGELFSDASFGALDAELDVAVHRRATSDSASRSR